jgi:hypothetical protein
VVAFWLFAFGGWCVRDEVLWFFPNKTSVFQKETKIRKQSLLIYL